MLKINKRMKEALVTFNRLDPDRGEIILHRVFSNPMGDLTAIFSEKEKGKLLKLLELTEDQLSNMIRAFSFIIMHTVAERNLPEVEKTLLVNGLDKDHLDVFINSWVQNSSEYMQKIREKPVAISDAVVGNSWQLFLPLENSNLPIQSIAHMREEGEVNNYTNSELYPKDARNPMVLLNLETSAGEVDERKKFTVKMTKSDIQNLFENMENIQDQLDQLI